MFTAFALVRFNYSCLSCHQSYLIGIVVPDPEVFVDWAKERGFVGSYEELCQNPVGHILILQHYYFHVAVCLQKTDEVNFLPTGCKECSIRGHESCGEGSRTQVL